MADYLKIGHFVLMISLDLTKSSEVRKAGDQSNREKKRISNFFLEMIAVVVQVQCWSSSLFILLYLSCSIQQGGRM